jgi:hypothetical protein
MILRRVAALFLFASAIASVSALPQPGKAAEKQIAFSILADQDQGSALQKAAGVRKLGFDPAARDEVVVLLEPPVAGAPLATLALKTGTFSRRSRRIAVVFIKTSR